MRPKKNPKADLNKYSTLFFAIGLSIMLLISWQVVELKTVDSITNYEPLEHLVQDDNIIPVTAMQLDPPPPPPKEPTDFDIKPDDDISPEDIVKPTEPITDEIIEDVLTLDLPVDIEVPYILVQNKPIFPGCENVIESERTKCFQEKMQRHINKNFRYPEIPQEMGIEGRVYVQFVIAKDGSITGIQTRGPDKNLEKEAKRIISKLPKMTPGKQQGQLVRVPFSIPINFRLQ